MYAFGDVVIINFPFSNGIGSKRRPAIVIRDTNDGDTIIVKVTSQLYNTSFDVEIGNWKQAGLIAPSVVRVHKIQTIQTSLLIGLIGKIPFADKQLVKEKFRDIVPV